MGPFKQNTLYTRETVQTHFLWMSRAISVCTFRYSWAILQCCSNTAMDSLELGQGVRGCKHTHRSKLGDLKAHAGCIYNGCSAWSQQITARPTARRCVRIYTTGSIFRQLHVFRGNPLVMKLCLRNYRSLSVQLSEGRGLGPEADSMELRAARDLECNAFVGRLAERPYL